MTIDEQALREAAEGATSGVWELAVDADVLYVRACHVGHHVGIAEVYSEDADARFIAAANPQLVLALLDELAEVRAFKEKYHEQWMLYAETVKRVEKSVHDMRFRSCPCGIEVDRALIYEEEDQ